MHLLIYIYKFKLGRRLNTFIYIQFNFRGFSWKIYSFIALFLLFAFEIIVYAK